MKASTEDFDTESLGGISEFDNAKQDERIRNLHLSHIMKLQDEYK